MREVDTAVVLLYVGLDYCIVLAYGPCEMRASFVALAIGTPLCSATCAEWSSHDVCVCVCLLPSTPICYGVTPVLPLTDKRLLLRDVPGMDAAVSLSGNTIERLV